MKYYFNYALGQIKKTTDPSSVDLTGYVEITETEYEIINLILSRTQDPASRMNFENTQVTELTFGNIYYVSPSFSFQSLIEADIQLIIPAIQLTNIKTQPISNTFDGNTVITLRNNTIDTALQLTIAGGSIAQEIDYEDITTANYDLLSFKIDTTASTIGRLSLASLVTEYIKII